MRVVPRNPVERILFYQLHAPKWAENAVEIGVSPEMVAELDDAVAAAKMAMSAQHQAQLAARSATQGLQVAMEKLSNVGSSLMLQIRAAGKNDKNSPVYPLASVPPPKRKSPLGKPGTPTRFSAQLLPMGWIEIRWKCRSPRGSQGTVYEIVRQIGHSGAFEPVGTVGKKRFLDRSIPPGTARVTYGVTAIRSTGRGAAGMFPVSFGNSMRRVTPDMQIKSGAAVLSAA